MIIAIAYPMINWSEGIIVKFVLLALLSFTVTGAIYSLFIKPFNIMRFLFGMKSKQKLPSMNQVKETPVSNVLQNT